MTGGGEHPLPAAPPDPGPTPLRYIPELDGIRGVAVLLVLWFHLPLRLYPSGEGQLFGALNAGYLGVDLFFVLSGFLITRILLRDREARVPLRYFYGRRVLRIFPIYFLTLAVCAVCRPDRNLLWCAAYLSNFRFAFVSAPGPMVHTWSLSVEEQFYLVWPALVYRLTPRYSRRLIVWIIIPLSLISAALIAELSGTRLTVEEAAKLLYFSTTTQAASLGLGARLAYRQTEGAPGQSSAYGARRVWAFLAVAIAVAVAARMIVPHAGFYRVILYSAVATAGIAQTLSLAGSDAYPARLLRSKPLRYVGLISYALYLYHYPIFYGLKILPQDVSLSRSSVFLRSVFALTLTFALAAFSRRLIELPAMKLIRFYPTPPATRRRRSMHRARQIQIDSRPR